MLRGFPLESGVGFEPTSSGRAPGALPEAPPTHIAATVGGSILNQLGFFLLSGSLMYISRFSIL